ncbi:hypothetical protein F7725_013667 [Dissostichus mawsoni]|uniref:Uncharacterized protein n=1 Tax=Dissostichus mawsoni TaxID=36200 RepID=A0A7J5YW77_DISMA|nr:hypothetical protein F7725_013667 [Dissostichus mawsoni]
MPVKLEVTQLPTGGLYDRPDPHSGATRYPNAKPLSINVAPSGLDDGPVPFGDDTQYPNAGYDVTKEGQTGRSTADGPVPYERAFHYTNADPTKDMISYGYGGYPLGNMDVAESNTTASGRVDGPVPYGGATRHTNANPVKKDSQSGNLGSIPSGVAPEVISYGYGGDRFANMDGKLPNYPQISLEACLYCLTLSLVADRNTAASGSVDGPVPHGAATRYANAKPVSKDFQ